MINLDDVWKRVAKAGPGHLLLNKDGEVEMTVVALQKNPDLMWDLIYFRGDGYTLGCEFYLAQYAEALHRDDWIALVRRGDKIPRPMTFRLDTT